MKKIYEKPTLAKAAVRLQAVTAQENNISLEAVED